MDIIIWILIIILFIGEIALFYLFFKFFKTLSARFNGYKGKDVLAMLKDSMDKSENVEKSLKEFFKQAEKDRALLRTTLHKVGFVRFNPFKDMGGNHSFAITLLDADHNGFVITSHYGRDEVRTYAKQIKNGKSEQQLSDEEEKSLNQAIKM